MTQLERIGAIVFAAHVVVVLLCADARADCPPCPECPAAKPGARIEFVAASRARVRCQLQAPDGADWELECIEEYARHTDAFEALLRRSGSSEEAHTLFERSAAREQDELGRWFRPDLENKEKATEALRNAAREYVDCASNNSGDAPRCKMLKRRYFDKYGIVAIDVGVTGPELLRIFSDAATEKALEKAEGGEQ